jgi:hypothetical protein
VAIEWLALLVAVLLGLILLVLAARHLAERILEAFGPGFRFDERGHGVHDAPLQIPSHILLEDRASFQREWRCLLMATPLPAAVLFREIRIFRQSPAFDQSDALQGTCGNPKVAEMFNRLLQNLRSIYYSGDVKCIVAKFNSSS